MAVSQKWRRKLHQMRLSEYLEVSRNPKTFSALCVKGHIWKDSSSTGIFLEGSLKTTAQNGPSEVMWPGQAAQRASSSLISTRFDDITPRQRCEICTYKYSFIHSMKFQTVLFFTLLFFSNTLSLLWGLICAFVTLPGECLPSRRG